MSPHWRQTVPLKHACNLNYYKAMLQVWTLVQNKVITFNQAAKRGLANYSLP